MVNIMDGLNYTALGQRIRKARQNKNITQEKLGEICALSTAHIGHIERGTRVPSLDTIYKIACELDVSIDFLLFDSLDNSNSVFKAISAKLEKKNPVKVKTFMSTIKALADKIDEL